jgi:chemotaxis protein CheD
MTHRYSDSRDVLAEHYFLQPGYIIVPDRAISVSTVIGSGACICLYDRKQKTGGMNHFQYPYITEKGKTTPIYGNVSSITLLKMMLNQASKKKHLEAQIFGGAHNPKYSDRNIGAENVEIARKILLKWGITIISQDIGGEKGRKIVFNISTNEVAVLKVDSLRSEDWYPYT